MYQYVLCLDCRVNGRRVVWPDLLSVWGNHCKQIGEGSKTTARYRDTGTGRFLTDRQGERRNPNTVVKGARAETGAGRYQEITLLLTRSGGCHC